MTDWHLLIQDDEGSAVAVPLSVAHLSLGREEENLVRLTQRNVSRKHAVLTRQDEIFNFEDLGSSNGSFLNGQKIESTVGLKNGDTIQIGDYVLQLYQGDLDQLQDDNSENIDLKTDPGINLAGLSEISMEFFGQNISDVSGSYPTRQIFSWAGLNETPPDSVFIHDSLFAAQQILRQQESTQYTQGTLPLPNLKEQDGLTRVDATVMDWDDDSEEMSQEQISVSSETPSPLASTSTTKTTQINLEGIFDTIQTTETALEQKTATLEAVDTAVPIETTQEIKRETTSNTNPERIETTRPTQPAIPEIQALPRLIIMNTDLAGKVFPLLEDNITMGRIPQTDFSIAHKSVSRRHARIYRDEEKYFVEDLESVNGIVVNGENKSPMLLTDNDNIELGKVVLRFCKAGNPFTLSQDAIKKSMLESGIHPETNSSEGSFDLAGSEHHIKMARKKNKVFFWAFACSESSLVSEQPNY